MEFDLAVKKNEIMSLARKWIELKIIINKMSPANQCNEIRNQQHNED